MQAGDIVRINELILAAMYDGQRNAAVFGQLSLAPRRLFGDRFEHVFAGKPIGPSHRGSQIHMLQHFFNRVEVGRLKSKFINLGTGQAFAEG